jgi:hypothetical protein
VLLHNSVSWKSTFIARIAISPGPAKARVPAESGRTRLLITSLKESSKRGSPKFGEIPDPVIADIGTSALLPLIGPCQ